MGELTSIDEVRRKRIEVAFTKAHAAGNDFLLIEETVAHGRHAAMARSLCSRHTGIGADGIEFLERRADGSYFLRLFNSDGSEAELSGNGTRCVAAWLASREGLRDVSLGTHGGVRRCVVEDERAGVWIIRSGMGVPQVMPRSIEVEGVPGALAGALVNVGNPHFAVFTDAEDFSVNGMRWQDVGACVSVAPMFPHGTNVEFVQVRGDAAIAFRIFERGCGPTMSSGTGTSASAAAAMELLGLNRELSAEAEGGVQQVAWASRDAELLLTGPAELICSGRAWC